jgi:hypothetical protein
MRGRAMSVPGKVLAALALFAVLSMVYPPWKAHQQAIGEKRATLRHNTAIEAQNAEADKLLKDATERADTASQALREFVNRQEKTDAIETTKIAELETRLRALAGPAGRLRDPYATAASGPGCAGPSGSSPSPAGAGAGNAGSSTGLLSPELSQFLIGKLADAERVSAAYASCRPYAERLKESMP